MGCLATLNQQAGRRMIRIGIVGAGANTRTRHIPGLRAQRDVEIVGVVNRTPESTARAATELAIPRLYARWEDLVADPQIDAVVVGTWPDLHAPVSVAALAAGKHVLTEARMARNLAEARQMLAAAQAHPQQTAMVVPSPFGLSCGSRVQELIAQGYLGELRELVVIGADDQFHDYSRPLHWRQDAAKSGLNVLTLGILHETALRWTPQPARVFAQSQTFETSRLNPHGQGQLPVTVPDSVQVLTQFASGARGLYHFSGMTLFGPGKQIHLYGSSGTIKVEFAATERVWVGRCGEPSLRELLIPPEKLGQWRVEEEFVRAIRGEEPVRLNSFDVAVPYMAFTEAVAHSAESGRMADVPT
jgi:predicted dehydrogenase